MTGGSPRRRKDSLSHPAKQLTEEWYRRQLTAVTLIHCLQTRITHQSLHQVSSAASARTTVVPPDTDRTSGSKHLHPRIYTVAEGHGSNQPITVAMSQCMKYLLAVCIRFLAAKDTGIGIFWLLVVNFVLFALDNFAGQNWVRVRGPVAAIFVMPLPCVALSYSTILNKARLCQTKLISVWMSLYAGFVPQWPGPSVVAIHHVHLLPLRLEPSVPKRLLPLHLRKGDHLSLTAFPLLYSGLCSFEVPLIDI